MSNYKSMFIAQGKWDDIPTFQLIPLDSECPFVEGLYDPEKKILVLISKVKHQILRKRAIIEENIEHHIVNKSDIHLLLSEICNNYSAAVINQYL